MSGEEPRVGKPGTTTIKQLSPNMQGVYIKVSETEEPRLVVPISENENGTLYMEIPECIGNYDGAGYCGICHFRSDCIAEGQL